MEEEWLTPFARKGLQITDCLKCLLFGTVQSPVGFAAVVIIIIIISKMIHCTSQTNKIVLTLGELKRPNISLYGTQRLEILN